MSLIKRCLHFRRGGGGDRNRNRASTVFYCLFKSVVFKILKIHPDTIEPVLNLRDLPHKQLNLNFSNNDVQWNPLDGKYLHIVINCVHKTNIFLLSDSQLATAPTNGSVVLWDITKRTKSKLGKYVFSL